MDFYVTGLPWESIDKHIDLETFEYQPPVEAKKRFEAATSHSWRNEDDSKYIKILCPREGCRRCLVIPWNREVSDLIYRTSSVSGFAEREFSVKCHNCQFIVTHETLRVAKFRSDMQDLMRRNIPLPGTVLSIRGQPEAPRPGRYAVCSFPSLLVQRQLSEELSIITTQKLENNSPVTMSDVKAVFEKALSSRKIVRKAKGSPIVFPGERVAVRRMMSRYWLNSSPFALDLAAAVIRQGETDKGVVSSLHLQTAFG